MIGLVEMRAHVADLLSREKMMTKVSVILKGNQLVTSCLVTVCRFHCRHSPSDLRLNLSM